MRYCEPRGARVVPLAGRPQMDPGDLPWGIGQLPLTAAPSNANMGCSGVYCVQDGNDPSHCACSDASRPADVRR